MNIDCDLYQRQGYLLFPNFFPATTIQSILDEAKQIFVRQFIQLGYLAEGDSDLQDRDFDHYLFQLFQQAPQRLFNTGKQIQHMMSLHRLSVDQRIGDLLNGLGLSAPVISTRPVVYFNHHKLARQKVYFKVEAHQDWRSMQGSLNSVVIWLPLMDIDDNLGALQVLPGSHRLGLLTDHMENGFGMVALTAEQRQQMCSVPVKRGDLLIFSAFLIHQSGDNISNTPRWSCHFRYNDLDETSFVARGFPHPYLYKPQDELLEPGFPSLQQLQSIYPE